MKSSLRAALAVGAFALTSSQCFASIVSPTNMAMTLAMGDTAIYTQSGLDGANMIAGDVAGNGLDRWKLTLTSPMTNLLANFIVSTDAQAPLQFVSGAKLWNWNHTTLLGSAAAVSTGPNSSLTTLSVSGLAAGVYLIDVLGDVGAGYQGSVSAVPLPAAAWLFGSALMGFGALRRKQKSGEKSEMAAA